MNTSDLPESDEGENPDGFVSSADAPFVSDENALESASNNNEALVGPDLRADNSPTSLYYKLREARAAARTVERANTAKKPEDLAPNPHWKKILEWAPQALEQSKDLEIAAWYTEALLREYNFEGLATGFALIGQLVQEYGQALYPAFDEEEGLLDSTLAPLAGLNGTGSNPGTLVSPINCVVITDALNGSNFATWQYTQSLNLARAPNETVRRERIQKGVPTMDTLMAAAQASSADFYKNLSTHLNSAIQNYQTLMVLLDEKFGHSAPPSSHIKNALSACRKAIQSLAKDKLAKVGIVTGEGVEDAQEISQSQVAKKTDLSSSLAGTTLENRTSAIDQLRNLADFFKRTEPHSPIGYTLDRVVRWSGMELPALLRELITERHVQADVERTTGVEIALPAPVALPGAPAPYGYNNTTSGGGFDPYASPAAGSYGSPAYDPNMGMGLGGGLGGNSFDPMSSNPGGIPSGGGGFGNNSF